MRVFVSYSSPDRVVAERLAAALCARGDGIEVFLDTWTLQPGAFWLPELARELERANAVVLLLGKTSPGNWQTLSSTPPSTARPSSRSFRSSRWY